MGQSECFAALLNEVLIYIRTTRHNKVSVVRPLFLGLDCSCTRCILIT